MKKILCVLLMVLVVSVLMFGAGQQEGSVEEKETTETMGTEKKVGGILKVAIEGEPAGLDTAGQTGTQLMRAVWSSQEYLFDFDENFKIVPQLAESWEWDSSGKVITFSLKQGVSFHNGKEMTSEDVLASWNRGKEMVISSTKFAKVAAMEAPDASTFKVTLTEPSPTFLEIMAGQVGAVPIFPKEVAESTPAGKMTVDKIIGTGPYKLAEWRKGAYVRLVRFDGYDGPKEQYFDEIHLIPVTEVSARLSGVLAGDYHIALNLPVENFSQVVQNPDVVALKDSIGQSHGLFLNHAKPPMDNLKFRQAMMAALNMEDILMAVVGERSFFTLNPSWVAEGSVFQTDIGKEIGAYNQNDPEKAKRLLEEMGYNGEPLILMPIIRKDMMSAALVAYEQFQKAGFNVELTPYDNAVVREVRGNPDKWHIYFSGIRNVTIPYPLAMFFNPNGYMAYANEKIDALWDRMLSEPELQKRIDIWEEIEKEIYTDIPFIKYGDHFVMHVVSKDVGGWRMSEDRASSDLVFYNAWFWE